MLPDAATQHGGKLIRLTKDDESFRAYTPRRVCVLFIVDFHGLAGVGDRATPTSPVNTF